MCIGGHMSDIVCSCLDPMFIMHHAFVDCQFEWWKASHGQSSWQYPSDCLGCHAPNAPMSPFANLLNKDGMNDTRIGKSYTCAPSPGSKTCKTTADCSPGDRGLRCNSQGRCEPTRKPGSSCTVASHCRCTAGRTAACVSGLCRC